MTSHGRRYCYVTEALLCATTRQSYDHGHKIQNNDKLIYIAPSLPYKQFQELFVQYCLIYFSGDENVVPIVMGGANYAKLAVPGSYINVMDFKTVKQLAEYLQYLDQNSTAYNEYFKWRLKYKVTSGRLDRSLCAICKWFDPENPPKTTEFTTTLEQFW